MGWLAWPVACCEVAPGFRYAGQWVLLIVSTRSYMVSPPDAVTAFPSAEAVVGAIGQIAEKDW